MHVCLRKYIFHVHMGIYVCKYICIYMNLQIYKDIYLENIYIYIYICLINAYIYIHICIHIDEGSWIQYIHTYIYIHIHIYIYIFAYIYIYMYVLCIYLYMHICTWLFSLFFSYIAMPVCICSYIRFCKLPGYFPSWVEMLLTCAALCCLKTNFLKIFFCKSFWTY